MNVRPTRNRILVSADLDCSSTVQQRISDQHLHNRRSVVVRYAQHWSLASQDRDSYVLYSSNIMEAPNVTLCETLDSFTNNDGNQNLSYYYIRGLKQIGFRRR
jgi:hypothetical protein